MSPTEDAQLYYEVAERVWRRFRLRPLEKEDAIQEAVVACLRLRSKFVPGRSALTTFLFVVAYSAMKDAWLKTETMKRKGAHVGLDSPAGLRLVAKENGPDEASSSNDDLRRVLQLIDGLPARSVEAIELFYGLGGREPASRRQIACTMGVTHQRVSQLIDRGISRVREHLSRDETAAAQVA